MVGKEEVVKVPAGTYKAVRVEFIVATPGGQPLETPVTYRYWYAAGAGEVRFVDGSSEFERALKSFTPGAK